MPFLRQPWCWCETRPMEPAASRCCSLAAIQRSISLAAHGCSLADASMPKITVPILAAIISMNRTTTFSMLLDELVFVKQQKKPTLSSTPTISSSCRTGLPHLKRPSVSRPISSWVPDQPKRSLPMAGKFTNSNGCGPPTQCADATRARSN